MSSGVQVAESVDLHHATLALVVEPERLRLTRRSPCHGKSIGLERRHEVTIIRCTARLRLGRPRRVRSLRRRVPGRRPRHPVVRCAGDDVPDEIADCRDAGHRADLGREASPRSTSIRVTSALASRAASTRTPIAARDDVGDHEGVARAGRLDSEDGCRRHVGRGSADPRLRRASRA